MTRDTILVTGLFLLLLLILSGAGVDAAGTDIVIGGLYPGQDPDSEAEILAGWDMAVDDINSYYRAAHIPLNLHIIAADAGRNATTAEEAVRNLNLQGAVLYVGPYITNQTREVYEYLNNEKILSLGSIGSGYLLPAGDTFFSLNPHPSSRIHALLAYEKKFFDTTPFIVPVGREDYIADLGIFSDMTSLLTEYGFRWSEPIMYGIKVRDFSDLLDRLDAHIKSIQAMDPEVPVVIMVTGGDEVSLLLDQANAYPSLAELRWFGLSEIPDPAIVETGDAALFAEKTSYSVALSDGTTDTNPRFLSVLQEIEKRTGNPVTVQGLTAYDQVLLAGMLLKDAPYLSSGEYPEFIPLVSSTLYGATGSLALDTNGERISDRFIISQVRKDDSGSYHWVPVAVTLDDTITVI
ncbi:MAG: ABC transporter substrate-binding protein [Methanospirillaceae archaeon]|nr:ABC transporter substrate-binding protein [Methanospirillaceae archaeon]